MSAFPKCERVNYNCLLYELSVDTKKASTPKQDTKGVNGEKKREVEGGWEMAEESEDTAWVEVSKDKIPK
jgi:hypothetical protein